MEEIIPLQLNSKEAKLEFLDVFHTFKACVLCTVM